MELTDKQLTLWKEQGSDFSAPPALKQQTLNFYQQYKEQEHFAIDKADLVLKVAYFLAEKAQVLYDREGHKLKSIAISANSILRDHPKHQEFLYHLLQMLRSITIPPEASHLEEEVASFSRHFSSSLTFLNKLKSTLKKIKINRKIQEPNDYQQLAIRMMWLLFIDCRNDLQLGIDIIQSTCLLGCTISYYTLQKYQEEGVFSIYFEHENQGCTLSNQPEELSSFLMNYLHIKDSNTYFQLYKKMTKYLSVLQKSIDLQRPFHHQLISKNIYLLQKRYEKKLSDGRLDESTFLKNNTLSNQPARITPFGRKAPLAPKTANALSHKILNFQNWEESQENKPFSDNKKEEKTGLQFLNKLKLQPTPKGTLIRATPVSEAMQTYNWLFEKSGRYPLSTDQLAFIQEVFEASLLRQSITESKNDHCRLAGSLWKETLQKYDSFTPKTLLLLSVYVVCHVLNAPTTDISIPIELLNISELQIWQALDQLINNFDRNMPISLKINLLTLQTSFISHRLWTQEENIECIKTDSNSQHQRLTKRVVHQGAYILHLLSKKLEISDELSDASFLVFQQALQAETDLLYNKCLQHIIACSLYAASKVKEGQLRFTQILGALKETLGLASGPFNQLVQSVKLQDKKENIIVFYNSFFVPSIRPYLMQLKSSTTPSPSPGFMTAKLKEVLAKEATSLNSPQMAGYFAYCESPMLKNRCLRQLNTNSNIISLAPGTIKRQSTYSLADISAKFSKFSNNGLKETRKIKY